MKLNWAERLVVNNPIRILEQKIELWWFQKAKPFPTQAQALELGCGRGAGAALIRKAFQPASLWAMDLDLEMVQKARRRLWRDGQKPVFLCVGDSIRLPFKDASQDAVFVFGVLHHVPDWRAGVSEIARVLKDNGTLYLEELYPGLYQNFITRHILLHPTEDRFYGADLKKALAKHGLLISNRIEVKGMGILAVAVRHSEKEPH